MSFGANTRTRFPLLTTHSTLPRFSLPLLYSSSSHSSARGAQIPPSLWRPLGKNVPDPRASSARSPFPATSTNYPSGMYGGEAPEGTHGSGCPRGRARRAGGHARRVLGKSPECLFCPPAKTLPLEVPALGREEDHGWTRQASLGSPQRRPYRGCRRGRDPNPFPQANCCSLVSRPLMVRKSSQAWI